MLLKLIFALFFIFPLFQSCPFPLYNQCDSRWGSIRLSWFSTVCSKGSLFTSVSSLLKGYNVTLLDSQVSDPQTFLKWLHINGYSTSNYDWKSIISLGFQYYGFQANEALKKSINSGYIALLYSPKQNYWVLCHEFNDLGYMVHDPLIGDISFKAFEDIHYGGIYKYEH